MVIGDHNLKEKVFIVAEIGNNHEGSYALAEDMLGLAVESGADAVKFQTFIPELFVSNSDPARLERMKKFQLKFSEFESLSKYAKKSRTIFFSTPLDLESAKFLNSIQDVFKIASADNTFYPLLKLVASFGKPTIVSTGLGDPELVLQISNLMAEEFYPKKNCDLLAFLHCVSAYPVPSNEVNLLAQKTLKKMFPESIVGYSDHTLGIDACIYAVAAGAKIVEKHFTLNKNYSDFRDHQLSADPNDLKFLVQKIREIETMNGSGEKIPQSCEEALRPALRRSIAVSKDLEKGMIITEDCLTWLRPGTGFLCGEESKILGKTLNKKIAKGSLILPEDLLN